jgi:hypothetical protein
VHLPADWPPTRHGYRTRRQLSKSMYHSGRHIRGASNAFHAGHVWGTHNIGEWPDTVMKVNALQVDEIDR